MRKEQQLPLWDTWTGRLPRAPFCCDEFSDGLRRLPREQALIKRHLEFNHSAFLNWLIYDLDQPDAFEIWDRVDFQPPNLFVENPQNGHAHLFYALATPVGLSDAHRRAPVEFAAAVQRGMVKRLGADAAYPNRFAKNPRNLHWRASWFCGQPYELRALRDRLDVHETRLVTRAPEVCGLGRNCHLFDQLRLFAYTRVLARKRAGNDKGAWHTELFSMARRMNAEFNYPLPTSEVRHTARSVANWTWRKFCASGFSSIQAARAARPRGSKTTSEIIASVIGELDGADDAPPEGRRRPRAISVQSLANKVGVSARTIRRYAARSRQEYEAESLERSAPWDIEGVSRATWFRRRRGNQQ